MATREELEDALMNADKAGDKAAAQALADALSNGEFEGYQPADQPKTAAQQYDEMPGWKKPLVAMDDIVRAMANGATFGYADKIAAKGNELMGSGTYDENLKAERQAGKDAADRAGWADTAAKAVGGVGSMAALRVPSAIAAIPRTWGLPARAAAAVPLGAAEGAAYGALDASGNDQDIGKGALVGGAVGGVAAPVVEGISQMATNVLRRMNGTNRTPSLNELEAGKNALYQDVQQAEAMYPGQRIVNTVNDLNTELMNNRHGGIRAIRHPQADDMMTQLNDLASTTQGESLYDLDILRQTNTNDVLAQGGSEARHGGRIQRGLDDLIGDTSGVTTTRGTPQEAVDSLLSAREANRRFGNSADLAGEAARAGRRVAGTSGSSEGNPMRQRVAAILNSPGRTEYYNPTELGLLEQVVQGTPGGNAARRWSDRIGGLRGMMLGGVAGETAGRLVGAPYYGGLLGSATAAAGGKLLDNVAERSTQRAFDDAAHYIATGRRLARGKAGGPISAAREADLERLMLEAGIQSFPEDRKRKQSSK